MENLGKIRSAQRISISGFLYSVILALSLVTIPVILFGSVPTFWIAAVFVLSFFPIFLPKNVLALPLGTLTTGAAVDTVINLNYLPEYIWYVAATQLTGVKIEILGEGVILDLDSTGLSQIGRANKISGVTNGYRLPLANGKIFNKNVVMTFTNSAAQTPTVYGFGETPGNQYIFSNKSKAFAGIPFDLPMAELDLVGFANGTAATDTITIRKQGGFSDIWYLEDLKVRNAEEDAIDNSANDYYLDNLPGDIVEATYTPTADTVLYTQKTVDV